MITAILAVVLTLGLVPLSASAASGPMSIGGATVKDLTGDANGTGWTWNAGTNTLTLDSGYEGENIKINCHATDTINLVYSGNVTIEHAISCYGASLNISGSGGTLTVNATSYNVAFTQRGI